MRTFCVKNGLVVGVILLFVGVAVQPSIGLINNNDDDTTPPVTTHTLDPPEPDGENGWYVNDVNVTLSATDDISGVNATYYRINSEEWQTYDSPFVVSEDGDDILIEYYSVDKASNVEDVKSARLDIDQTPPGCELTVEIFYLKPLPGWYFIFTMNATDAMSRMNRVEFYIDDELQETVTGPGWSYKWEFQHPYWLFVIGLIRNREITDEYVKFYAIIVLISTHLYLWTYSACAYDNAGNMAKKEIGDNFPYSEETIYTYQQLGFLNDYVGYIGRHFILARF